MTIEFSAYTELTGLCGDFTYSLTGIDSAVYTFDPVNFEIIIYTNDLTMSALYNVGLVGTLASGFSITTTFRVKIGGACIIANLGIPYLNQ